MFDVLLLGSIALLTLFGAARVGLAPRDPQAGVAVIFAPWTQPDATLVRATDAGGRFVRFARLPFIAIVMPEDSAYPARMLSAGAWLVIDPKTLEACLGPISRS
jgi:hypothetical protein